MSTMGDVRVTDAAADVREDAMLVPSAVDDVIRRHASETYPDECCGALIGSPSRIAEAYPLRNTTEEGPRRRFLVRSEDYLAAERHARRVGGELLGFYHSHPDHPARPSQYDLDHAWPSFIYLIIGVVRGTADVLTAWRLRDDRSEFESVTLKSA